MELYARKDLDKIVEDINPEAVEERRKYNVESEYAPLLQKYESFLKNYEITPTARLLEPVTEVLLPDQINSFLQATINYENYPHYAFTGQFVAWLIQNSYDAGHNDFHLETNHLTTPLSYLGSAIDKSSLLRITSLPPLRLLKGSKERMLRIEILGNAGILLGNDATHVAYKCSGNVATSCADKATYCSFQIGDELEDISRALHCEFVMGRVGLHLSPRSGYACSFKTADVSTLRALLKKKNAEKKAKAYERLQFQTEQVRLSGDHNTIYFIKKDGTQELVWTDDDE